MFFGEVGRDGRPYAPYGPLVAVLALPHHLIGRAIAALTRVPRAPLPDGIAWLVLVGGVTMLSTATAGALTVAGFHRAVRALGAPPDWAVALSLTLGGATVLWPYSTSFFSEAWQAAAFIWAAAFLLEARSAGGPPAKVLLSAGLLLVSGLTKFTSLVFAPAFVAAILAERALPRSTRVRAAAALCGAIAGAAAVHVVWNLYRFGRPFDFGYDWSETIPAPPARAFLASDIPRGLALLLLSPGKSIVLWAPVLIVAIVCFRRFWTRARAAACGVLTATVPGLIFYAAYLFPEGGYSHGPRNLVPIVPLMLLPAAIAPAAISLGARRALIRFGAAAGALVALLAVSVSYLEDQSLGGDLTSGARTVYYRRITPPQGRVWNQYRLDYIPFVATLRSPGWLTATTLGEGPDYFPLHLLQARRQLPNGASIPFWVAAGWPVAWAAMLIASAMALRRSQ